MAPDGSVGLRMLGAEVAVSVTREQHHQRVLERYAAPSGERVEVTAELGWCVTASGKYQGERAIEVRLDGSRVGELSRPTSQRYAPTVAAIIDQGGRPGCRATVFRGKTKLEVELLLPRAARRETPAGRPHAAPVASAEGHEVRAHLRPRMAVPPSTTLPPAPPPPDPACTPAGRFTRSLPAWLSAAAVVVGILVIGQLAESDGDSGEVGSTGTTLSTTPTPTAALTTTTAGAPSSTTTVRTTTSTTRSPSTTRPPSSDEPTRMTPEATREPTPPPTTSEPVADCDPNYSGCVPVASDVDCAGGSGNGPAYVSGPVRVTGSDIYGLDRDGDGIACDS